MLVWVNKSGEMRDCMRSETICKQMCFLHVMNSYVR